ncbi:hypothetical protein VNO80_26899 [Phaseolus coccineus]|uniref:Uncharacterized protein n=1 Tax=Phaseolus coccineus TaxID=3886 RepID=A0AAN9LFK8_PHACN
MDRYLLRTRYTHVPQAQVMRCHIIQFFVSISRKFLGFSSGSVLEPDLGVVFILDTSSGRSSMQSASSIPKERVKDVAISPEKVDP